MEWEEQFKRRLLQILKEINLDIKIDDIEIVDIGFPDVDMSGMTVQNLGRLYAFAIMKENYEEAQKVKDELSKRNCQIELKIDEKKKEGILDITFVPDSSVEHIQVNMKVLKDGLSIDWDKEIK
jgi:hypothetical protein